MVLVQRDAINIRPLPQETFDFYRYHTSFHIIYSIVSSKTYTGTGRGLPYRLCLFCHCSNLLLDCRQRTCLAFAYFDIKKSKPQTDVSWNANTCFCLAFILL